MAEQWRAAGAGGASESVSLRPAQLDLAGVCCQPVLLTYCTYGDMRSRELQRL